MPYEFNADEIFEIAEQIERNGARFYRKAAATMAAQPEDKRMLEDLAAMEDRHEQIFARMRAEVSEAEKASTAFDPDGLALSYARAMANGHVFDLKADAAEAAIDPSAANPMEGILKAAIQREKDSVVYFLGMQELTGEALGAQRVQGIVKEEMSHIALLSKRLSAIRK